MEILLLLSIILSFFSVFIILPFWIKKAKEVGLKGKDVNKISEKEVAEGGGVIVIAGFLLGILSYVAIKTFYFKSTENVIEIFSLISTILIITFIGLVDDIFGWKIGLSGKMRVILILIAAVPLMVINAGYSNVSIPFFDGTDLGWVYALIIIPIGILCTSVGFNTIAGYNGLEAGQGVLLMGALSLVSWLNGNSWLALIGLCMIASLLAFLFYNKYPAKVFPGNTLTFPLGALVAIFAILGNFEKIAIIFFIPYIIEVFLKLRGNLKMQSYAKPNADGSLDMRYGKIYGLEHIAIIVLKKIKGKVYEKDVVYSIYGIQLFFIFLGFLIFSKGLF